MDRNQAKEFYPILQAFAEGKTIETRRKPTTDNNGVTKDGWFEFNDWTEMKKHQPFGWVKEKVSKAFYCIGSFDVANIYVGTTNIIHSYADSLKNFTFADGTPFGVKVEE